MSGSCDAIHKRFGPAAGNSAGLAFRWKTYRRFSERWDHDHCVICWAKFMEATEDALREGYASLAENGWDEDDHWVCQPCWTAHRIELGWSLSDDREADISGGA